jgi:hypothetical protein
MQQTPNSYPRLQTTHENPDREAAILARAYAYILTWIKDAAQARGKSSNENAAQPTQADEPSDRRN